MRLVLNTDDITFATSTVSRIISAKTSGSSAGIRLTAEDNHLTLTANDLEIGIRCTIPGEIQECGSIVVPGRLFAEAVRRFPGEELELRMPEGRQVLSISCSTTAIDLVGMSPLHFPELPDIEDYARMTIPQHLLRSMLRQTSFALSSDDMRPILTGMLWEYAEDTLRMVAADGFKVASRKEAIGNQSEQSFRLVIPGKTITELIRLLEENEELVEVAIGKNHVLIRMAETTIISRLLEGNYLNVDQYLPSVFVTEAVLKPKMLLEALERAAVVAKDGATGTVRLFIKEGLMTVRAQSAEYGSYFEEWPIDAAGDDLEIMFNIKVLSDVLKSIEQGDIRLKFTGSLGPCVGISPEHDQYWCLLMPVRLS